MPKITAIEPQKKNPGRVNIYLDDAFAFGLAKIVAAWLSVGQVLSEVGVTFIICLAVTFLTEVTSNTATATILMPVLAAAGMAGGRDPAWLMIPAVLSASCAFMLPVGTPPNPVVFGTGRVTMRRMAREGFALNILGAVALTLLSLLVIPRVFGRTPGP